MSDKLEAPSIAASLPPEKVEIVRELTAAFSGDRELIKNYLQKFGFSKVVAPNIRIIRREASVRNELFEKVKAGGAAAVIAPRAVAAAEKKKAKKDAGANAERSSYYQSEVGCPFCNLRFTASIFRTKTLIIDFSYKDPQFPLMVPNAKGTVQGYKLEDPLLRNIMVCPGCFYASNIMGNFAHDQAAGAKTLKSRVPDRKIAPLTEAMNAGFQDRRKIIPEQFAALPPETWGDIRSPEFALVSFLLAAESSRIMADFDSLAYFQQAEALLCAARLHADMDSPGDESDKFRQVIPILDKFFQIGSVSATPLYLIGVLSFHLGDYDASRIWIGRMISMRYKLEGYSKYKRYSENIKELLKEKSGDAGAA